MTIFCLGKNSSLAFMKRCPNIILFLNSMELMAEKSYMDITVTDIINTAQVARASFYRNYKTKTDVLTTLIHDILENYRLTSAYDISAYFSYENIHHAFSCFLENREYALDICNSGFGAMLLEELNSFHWSMIKTPVAKPSERYFHYFFIGALYNSAIAWIQDENRISTDEITMALLGQVKMPDIPVSG